MKTIGIVLCLSWVVVACGPNEDRPPAASSSLDAGPPRDASVDARASTVDAGIDLKCPPVASTNDVSINCTRMGTANYVCPNGDGPVYGDVWTCPDEKGVARRPPTTCVATARAGEVTSYICDPTACLYTVAEQCTDNTVAVTCPASPAVIASGCDKLPGDGGTTDTYCCPR